MAKSKSATLKRARRSKPKPASGYAHMVESIGGLIDAARQRVTQTINTEMARLYWEIGRHVVEYEQGGSDRAQYGARLLEHLSADLTRRYGRGFSLRNLRNFRLLYQAFPIRQAVPAELSWTHLLLILRVEEPLAREFYIKQCQRERWSTRELERQINSLLFERLALSRDKKGVLALAREGQQIQHPTDLLRDPFMFEFFDLPEPTSLSELELEARLTARRTLYVFRPRHQRVDRRHEKFSLLLSDGALGQLAARLLCEPLLRPHCPSTSSHGHSEAFGMGGNQRGDNTGDFPKLA